MSILYLLARQQQQHHHLPLHLLLPPPHHHHPHRPPRWLQHKHRTRPPTEVRIIPPILVLAVELHRSKPIPVRLYRMQ